MEHTGSRRRQRASRGIHSPEEDTEKEADLLLLYVVITAAHAQSEEQEVFRPHRRPEGEGEGCGRGQQGERPRHLARGVGGFTLVLALRDGGAWPRTDLTTRYNRYREIEVSIIWVRRGGRRPPGWRR